MYRVLFISVGFALFLSNQVLAADIFIAGTAPSQRPVNAPKITEFKKDTAWYQNALHGVWMPYPTSLNFLESQGKWYTPFNHPGLSSNYDVRYWYR